MNLLAIETATEACSVALSVDGAPVERHARGARIHARVLLPWIAELLAVAGLRHADLDAIAVDRGPGGFTSLRLGLGVAQGIALAHDLPVRPVSSLAALAQAARPPDYHGPLLAALDARMGEVYAAWFWFDHGRPVPQGEEMLLAPAAVDDCADGEFIAAGNAFAVHAAALREGLGRWPGRVIDDAWPTASAVAALARQATDVAAHELEPVYLRDRVTG